MPNYADSLSTIGAEADAEIARLVTAVADADTKIATLSADLAGARSYGTSADAVIGTLRTRVSDLEAQVAALTPRFSTRLAVDSTSGWESQCTTTADTITVLTRPDGKRVFRAKAGGHAPNSSGSTFARYRTKLPEVHGIAPRGRFGMSAKVRLLTTADNYYSFLRTDNYVATMKGTTTKVGCANGNEWRTQIAVYPGNDARFESTHQGFGTITLWRGTLLPGIHDVDYDLDPQVDATGSWSLTIDGKTYTGTGQTVPSTVPVAERVVTRAVTCIDGANRWTTKAVEVEVEEAVFWAARA